mmetsp:Transcript_23833/g.58451  ORF Transcript_23833/g.58451 Transcript_23833/m.58451 type:complete len:236 (-) Transcript_23833:302-1009(-)
MSWLSVQRMPRSIRHVTDPSAPTPSERALGDTRLVTRSPSSHSMTSTRRVAGNSGSSPGTRTKPGGGSAWRALPLGPYSASKRRMLAASFTKSISSKMRLANSSTASTAAALTSPLCSSLLAAKRSSMESAATRATMPGRCTFTATSRPASFPRYTWHSEAAATATPPSSTSSAPRHSAATMARACSSGAGAMSSCSRSSAMASSAPTRSERDASACPNLTYVGPMLSTHSTNLM